MPDHPVEPRHQTALRAVIQRYERPLVGFASHYVQDLPAAQAIARDTLLRLCQQDPESLDELLGTPDRGRIEGWLFVVARNLSINAAGPHAPTTPLDPAITLMTDNPAPHELADQIITLIGGLPPQQAEALHLRFQQGLPYPSIATITGQTVSYVGYLVHEGLKGLRQKAAAKVPRPAGEATA